MCGCTRTRRVECTGGLMPRFPCFGNLHALNAWRTTSTLIPPMLVDRRLREQPAAAAERDGRIAAAKQTQACAFLPDLKKNVSDSDWVVDLTKGDKFPWWSYIESIRTCTLQVGASGFSLQVCRPTGFQGHGGTARRAFRKSTHELLGTVLQGEFQIVVSSSIVISN